MIQWSKKWIKWKKVKIKSLKASCYCNLTCNTHMSLRPSTFLLHMSILQWWMNLFHSFSSLSFTPTTRVMCELSFWRNIFSSNCTYYLMLVNFFFFFSWFASLWQRCIHITVSSCHWIFLLSFLSHLKQTPSTFSHYHRYNMLYHIVYMFYMNIFVLPNTKFMPFIHKHIFF